jgi:DNA modification methylase
MAGHMTSDLTILEGDCIERMRGLEDGRFHAIVTDPPYGLSDPPDMREVLARWLEDEPYVHGKPGFMGRTWDSFVPGPECWREVHRVLKPGAFLLCFAGTRTLDLMGLSLRLAGFELLDTLHWTYGSGMNKIGMIDKRIKEPEVAGEWAGFGGALRPSHEPIIVAQRPRDGTIAKNLAKHGVGAFHIEACRVATGDALNGGAYSGGARPSAMMGADGQVGGKGSMFEAGGGRLDPEAFQQPSGRWPTNTLLTHATGCRIVGTKRIKGDDRRSPSGGGRDGGGFADVGAARTAPEPGGRVYPSADSPEWECEVGCPVAELDAQSGLSRSTGGRTVKRSGGGNVGSGKASEKSWTPEDPGFGDEGGASRYFPTSDWAAEAEDPLLDLVFPGFYCPKASQPEREAGLQRWEDRKRWNKHNTVKPLALMRWLVRLVGGKPGNLLLDPFMGSGTTGIAALMEGFQFVGIEQEAAFIDIAQRRIEHWCPAWTRRRSAVGVDTAAAMHRDADFGAGR